MNMTQGFREIARLHKPGSEEYGTMQQRLKRAKHDMALDHQRILQQRAGIQQRQGIEEEDEPSSGTNLQAQQQHQTQLQQRYASTQGQRLPASLAERYQRPLAPPGMQRRDTRTRNDMAAYARADLPAKMTEYRRPPLASHGTSDARRSSHSLDLKPDHSDKPSGPVDVGSYTQPFLSFISENPTIFHAVAFVAERLKSHGFIKLSERDSWTSRLTRGGKYFFERNGSSLIAFVVGEGYESGNGASVIATHIDALATRLKPIPTLSSKAGYVQLGVAPYAGALNSTWWDRDLGIGGRVLVKDSKSGKIHTRLVKLGWPIARIPTLAPHFGAAANLSNANKETEMVPIVGLDSADSSSGESGARRGSSVLGGAGTFTATQPERLVKAIAGEMNIQDCENSTFPILSNG